MAIALLFFSVKLFFFNPNEVSLTADGSAVSEQKTSSHEILKKPAENTEQPTVKKTVRVSSGTVYTKPVTAKPVDDSQKQAVKAHAETKPAAKEPVKTKPLKKDVQKITQAAVKEPVKPKLQGLKENTAPAKSETPKVAVKAGTPVRQVSGGQVKTSGSRWDVQIGGFSSKDNAAQLMDKAKTNGHDVYISESTLDGNVFYRVRVKGGASREEADKLSAELQKQGYPVYIVEIKQ